jgi:hypothetical protein
MGVLGYQRFGIGGSAFKCGQILACSNVAERNTDVS